MRQFNILLLGEAGVGKTTFINSFLNYFGNESFEAVVKNGVVVTAPMTVTTSSSNSKQRVLPVNANYQNEHSRVNSEFKEYVIQVENCLFRFIDTEGFSDSSNESQNVFEHLDHLKELHAVCFFLKTSASRTNTSFEYCVKHTLAQLDMPILRNFVFIFTNGRSTAMGTSMAKSVLTGVALKIKLKMPSAIIPLNDNNIFCLDNEPFVYLVAAAQLQGFHHETLKRLERSWISSVDECKRFANYIAGLRPYRFNLGDTIAALGKFISKDLTQDILYIFGSNSTNVEKLSLLRTDSKKASNMLQEIQQSLKLSNSGPKEELQSQTTLFQKTDGTIDGKAKTEKHKPKMSKNQEAMLTEDDSESEKHLPKSKMRGSRRGSSENLIDHPLPSSSPRTSKSKLPENHLQYSQVQFPQNTAQSESKKIDMETQDKFTKIQNIVENQQQFIANVYNVAKMQKDNIHGVLRNVAECAVFLEYNATIDDGFEKQIGELKSNLRTRRNLDGEKTCDDLLREYEKIKGKVDKNVDVSDEVVRKTRQMILALLAQEEIFNKITNYS